MLDKIIHFSIYNKLVIGFFTFALVLVGINSLRNLPIDAVPDITNNQVQVITSSPSLSAPDIERLITFPVELTMANIPNLTEIRSISRFGLSVVTIVFTDNTDVYWARQQVFERLTQVQNQIPTGVGTPELMPLTTGLGEIYQYTLRAKKGFEKQYPPMELRSIQDWIVRRQLLGTKGVADVSSFGGFVKQYEIAIDPDRLRAMNVSVGEIFHALETNNQNTGGAYIDRKPNAYFIRSEGLINTIQDIEQIVVKNTPNGSPVLIQNIAKVQLGHAVRYGAMTYNAEGETVGAIVMMLKNENSSKVIANVKDKIAQIQKSLPEGVVIEAFLDRTKLVNSAIGTVAQNLAEGALIVVFVLVLLLGNLRASLVVASVIPLAMLFAITMMYIFGVSGNLMSLGAIDFGLIVDGAVIIVEATLHHLAVRASTLQNKRITAQEMNEEVYQSASKIRSSAAFGEIIILIVYLPILALSGIEGKMFAPMAQTVGFAIAGAFILSLTYVPMMSALCLSKKLTQKKNFSDRIIAFFQKIYTPVLAIALRFKGVVVMLTLAIFLVSLWVFGTLGGEFIPSLDEGDFAVEVRLMSGMSLTQTVDIATKAGEILMKKFPEVKSVVGKIGSSEIPTDPMPVEACDFMVILKDRAEWTSAETKDELAEKMQYFLEQNIIGVEFGFQQPIQMRFNELMTGVRQDVAIKIFGEDLNKLVEYGGKIFNIVGKVEGAKDIYVEKIGGLPQIVVKFDRSKLAQFGLSVQEANQVINTAFAGSSAGLVFEQERRYDLVVRLDVGKRQGIEDVKNLFVSTHDGKQVPITQLASIELKNGYNEIRREDAKRRITVAFNVRGRDVESIVQEIESKIKQNVKFGAGYYISYGGQFQNLQEARARLMVAVPLALALILVLLYFTFNSMTQSLLIFTAIPLSAIGGIFALVLRGMPFSISAGVGFIALFGVAVLNGIVLIAEFNYLKKHGGNKKNTSHGEGEATHILTVTEIIIEGTGTRLRPVLMTAAVASLGFMPMALSHGAGAEVQKPLATVVIGGLLSATFLTLIVLPCLYMFLEKGVAKSNKLVVSVLLALGLLNFSVPQARAQQVLTLPAAIAQATQNNLLIKTGLYEIDLQNTLKKTAKEIPKTNIQWMAGQYNSPKFDNNFTISQTFPMPSTFKKTADFYDAQAKSSELKLQISKNDLTFRVKQAYYNLQASYAQQKMLLQQDSLLAQFVKATDARLRAGEGTVLEKSTAENQWFEVKNLILQNDADIALFQIQLKTLLNANTLIDIADKELTALHFQFLDTAALMQNPTYQYLKQQIEVSQKNTLVEQTRLKPDFTVGYFNQSLIGKYTVKNQEVNYGSLHRFQGVQAGVAIPVFAKPQKARIASAKINEQIAQTQAELYQKNLQGEVTQAYQQYLKFQYSLAYHETHILPNAKLIQSNAQKAFRGGDIGYLEYTQALSRVLTTQLAYIITLQNYNQAIIQIEFLVGK